MQIKNRYHQVSLMNIRSIALLGILTALTVILRLFFAVIPNVQPVTSLVIILTILLGMRYGFVYATLVIVISNLLLGFGIWTMGQILGYAIIVMLTSFVIRPFFARIPMYWMMVYAAFCGFLYGFILALTQIPLYGVWYFGIYYASGVLFDFYHAVGNACFYLILAPVIFPLLDKMLIQYRKN
ncbi:ECF transporter S component [Listeria sp. PSOL-1]|uniref:ECF transporter S component n=1 Tax=Listeria sp. PSOL-1 TaxID=1844999 RepID=UPI0013D410EF|nr:ECF transporter S component [Listeria sp. PSOL-1]